MSTRSGLGSNTNRQLVSLQGRSGSRLLILLALLAVLLLVPTFLRNEYFIRVVNTILIYSMLTLGLNIVLGYTGLFHFGQAAMFAIGAYTTALLTTRYGVSFPIAFILSIMLPVVASLLLGFPSLRIRGDYLALVTFAFGEIVRIVANSWVDFTRGPMGIPAIPPPNIFGIIIKGNISFYYFGLALTILVYLGCFLIANSHFGRAFLAIREDETAANALGINSGRYKILSFAISSIPAGIAGSYLATYLSFVGPTSFTVDVSILAVEIVILGGMTSFPGAILGSTILTVALELLRSIAEFRKAFIGITIILLLIFRPQGILSGLDLSKIIKTFRKNKTEPKQIPETAPSPLDPNIRALTWIGRTTSADGNRQNPKVDRNRKVLLKGTRVTKDFGGVRALNSLDFALFEGEILGLIGPNGSGKTTLFNVISGIFPPTSGEVFLEEYSLNKMPPYKIASLGLQRTFQNVRLFKRLTVLMNVKIGAHKSAKTGLLAMMFRTPSFRKIERETEEKARRWLTFVGLEDRAYEIARNLPYGEQKLLEMARALASAPNVLLLDEPAAGLNPNEVVALSDVIRRISEMGITIFVVEHNMRLIMDICDRIIVVNFGQEVAEGTPAEIQMNPAVQGAYLGTVE